MLRTSLAQLSSLGRLRLRPSWSTCGNKFYNFGVENWSRDSLKEIESDWKKNDRIRRALPKPSTNFKPFYILCLLPYSSGKLHLGHVRACVTSDAIAHFHRMQGKPVIHNIRLDLHDENKDIKEAKDNPAVHDQLSSLGCIFDRDREVYDYHKRTQCLFLEMFKRGLAYQRETVVNWDPSDKKVLSDEQVDETGQSKLSGALVEKKLVRQWFFKTSDFARELQEGLDDFPFKKWRDAVKVRGELIGKCTGHTVSPDFKDWLVSNQSCSGTPIPITHCQECGPVPVPESELPVKLPKTASPLDAEDWTKTKCPNCGGVAEREISTIDPFVDFSWCLDLKTDLEPPVLAQAGAHPVDICILDQDHAKERLHLARFASHFLHSVGFSSVKEPVRQLLVHGVVKGQSYRIKKTDTYIPESEVEFPEGPEMPGPPREKSTRRPVVVEWDKMSESKQNSIHAEEMLQKHGSDTLRMMLLSGAAPTSDTKWSEDSYFRIRNLQVRMLKLVSLAVTLERERLPTMEDSRLDNIRRQVREARNNCLKEINASYNYTHNLSLVLASIDGLVKEIWSTPGQAKRDLAEYHRSLAAAVITLAPIAPHLAAELWRGLSTVRQKLCPGEYRWDGSVFCQPWPQLDPDCNLSLLVRVDGKSIADIPVPLTEMPNLTDEAALARAFKEDKIKNELLHPYTYTLDKYPDYDATLNFVIDYSKMSDEDRMALRLEKFEKKKLRKERRKRKLEERTEAELKKKVVMNKKG